MMSLENELINIRRHLHKHPELSFEEFKTQKYIVNFFCEMNCVIHTVKTGVLVYFDNNKKDTISYRCELDALNIKERTNAQYKSENDYMHACGHDGHMAICLKLGEYINNNLDKLNNNYLLIFEHGEEKEGGAREIINDEFYLSHLPKYVFALHLFPDLEEGKIFLKKGYFLSKSVEIDISINGKASHVINKELGIDALKIGADYLSNIEKRLSKLKDICYLFGYFNSGKQRNVVSYFTNIKGTCRVFSNESYSKVKRILFEERDKIDKKHEKIVLDFNDNYMVTYNDDDLIDKVKKLYPIKYIKKLYIGESFGHYSLKSSLCYALLGIKANPLHSDKFDFDDRVLVVGYNYFLSLLNID